MNTNFVRAALLGGSALLALAATPAFAADTKAAADPAPAAAATDPATDSGELKDIVVTATKRETAFRRRRSPSRSSTRPC